MKFKSKIITEYLDSNKYDFFIFDIDYTVNEQKIINDFEIKNPNNYGHYGSLDDIKDLKKYLTDIGNNTKTCVNGMEKLIIRLIKKVLLGYKMKYFWLAIRISPPNNRFDIPRWHKDGTFFTGDKNEKSSVKFITTLKNEGETFYLTEQGTYKNNMINFLSGSAILMDTFICMTNTNFSVRTNLLIITFIIYIYSYVRPLYNMTHLGLHILLGFQTLALCQSNIVANM